MYLLLFNITYFRHLFIVSYHNLIHLLLTSKILYAFSFILPYCFVLIISIMSRQMGEMDYGPEEQLNYGATGYPERSDTDTEFHLISVVDSEEGTLRPDGGGGPVRGPSHPAAAGRGLPRAGGGRAAAACPTGGYRDPDALSGGKAEGLHGGPAAGGYPPAPAGRSSPSSRPWRSP